ncbi:hypothetical protein L596_020642 [Steinernema carpocapsae]|nr:hypothetical protein L596_020642 [Steinernema carpocapsae]
MKARIVHVTVLLLSLIMLIAFITVAAVSKDTYVISIKDASWIYTKMNEIASIETVLATGFTPATFALYALTCLHVLKIRSQMSMSSMGEIRLLVSCACGFFYEMITILLFHYVLPNVNIHEADYAICGTFWGFIPGFNGIMLLWLNKAFRNRFFSLHWHSFDRTTVVSLNPDLRKLINANCLSGQNRLSGQAENKINTSTLTEQDNWSAPIGQRRLVGANWSETTGRRQLVRDDWSAPTGQRRLVGANWSETTDHKRLMMCPLFIHGEARPVDRSTAAPMLEQAGARHSTRERHIPFSLSNDRSTGWKQRRRRNHVSCNASHPATILRQNSISAQLMMITSANITVEAVLSLILAVDRLQIICEIWLSYLFSICFVVSQMTPYAGYVVTPGQCSAMLDALKLILTWFRKQELL